ncbi:MAG TPA: PIG-L family deacetylase [Bacteroidota bacterium]
MKRLSSIAILLCSGLSVLFTQASQVQRVTPPDARLKTDVLLIVAHPDDETAVGSFLAKTIFDDHKEIAIVYCTRGNGGGNSVGGEQANSLGAIREIEARRATAVLGISKVWFLNGSDTPGQDVFRSLQSWGHGTILEQVVRLVRLTRPELVLTWLPDFVAGENHGDHQASGVIATEAFDMAGDPTVFPAQIAVPRERTDVGNWGEGLPAWQPKKIYYFSDASHSVKAEGPQFDIAAVSPSKNIPYYRLAAEMHTFHKTQGDVSQVADEALRTGDFAAFKKWLGSFNLIFGKSLVDCNPSGEIFDGIARDQIRSKQVRGFEMTKHNGVGCELGGMFSFYRDFWHAHNLDHLASLVEPEIEIAVRSYLHIPLQLFNSAADTVDITLTPEVPEGWRESSGSGTYRVAPGELYPVQTFFFAPAEKTRGFQTITWIAVTKSKKVGSASIKVKLCEWTLPQ